MAGDLTLNEYSALFVVNVESLEPEQTGGTSKLVDLTGHFNWDVCVTTLLPSHPCCIAATRQSTHEGLHAVDLGNFKPQDAAPPK
jgi:hypothetical protein